MDREADSFELFQRLIGGQHRFVILLSHDRKLEGGAKLMETVAAATVIAVREVQLSARVGHSAPSTRKIHPPREQRIDGWRIIDQLWRKIEQLLPPRPKHPLGYHNPRVPDRDAMNAILFVLRTGCQWNATIDRHLLELIRASAFSRVDRGRSVRESVGAVATRL
jgi:hypothetical protein